MGSGEMRAQIRRRTFTCCDVVLLFGFIAGVVTAGLCAYYVGRPFWRELHHEKTSCAVAHIRILDEASCNECYGDSDSSSSSSSEEWDSGSHEDDEDMDWGDDWGWGDLDFDPERWWDEARGWMNDQCGVSLPDDFDQDWDTDWDWGTLLDAWESWRWERPPHPEEPLDDWRPPHETPPHPAEPLDDGRPPRDPEEHPTGHRQRRDRPRHRGGHHSGESRGDSDDHPQRREDYPPPGVPDYPDWSGDYGSREHRPEEMCPMFDCVEVEVIYRDPKTGKSRFGMLYHTLKEQRDYPQCSLSTCMKDVEKNIERHMDFISKVKDTIFSNEPLRCYASPRHPEYAFLEKVHSPEGAIHGFLWPALFALLCLVMLLVRRCYFTCCGGATTGGASALKHKVDPELRYMASGGLPVAKAPLPDVDDVVKEKDPAMLDGPGKTGLWLVPVPDDVKLPAYGDLDQKWAFQFQPPPYADQSEALPEKDGADPQSNA